MNKNYIDAYKQIITQGWFGKKKAQIKSAVKNLFKSSKTKNKEKNETLNKFITKYGLSASNDQSSTWTKRLENFIFKMHSVSGYSNEKGTKNKQEKGTKNKQEKGTEETENKHVNKYETLECALINRITDRIEYEDDILFKYNWPLTELEEDIQEFLLRAKITLSDLKKGKTFPPSDEDDEDVDDILDNPDGNGESENDRVRFNDERQINRNNTKGGSAAKRRQIRLILRKLTPEQRQFLKNSLENK